MYFKYKIKKINKNKLPDEIKTNKDLMEMINIIEKKSDYFIKDLLGKGSFASVFEGESQYENNKNLFALKVINIFSQTEKYLTREININNLLKDIKFVIGFYENVHLSSKYSLLVLEKADFTLEQFLLDEKKRTNSMGLSELKAFFIFSQLLNGISQIHNINIIHRDLKPQNILMLNYQIKICDFTTAKKIGDSNNEEQTSLGTANYNSPEGFDTHKIIMKQYPSVDIWALGVILYNLVYGMPPYKIREKDTSPDFTTLIHQIEYDNKKVSDNFNKLIKRLLEIEVDKRINISQIRQADWFINNSKILCSIFPNAKNIDYNFQECYKKIEQQKN